MSDKTRRIKRTILFPGLFILLIMVIAGFGLTFFPGAKNKVERDGDLNVLLVTVDTTRADHIGVYGYETARTPNMDSLAAKGIKFANAYCPAPMTLPSHCSILTGTYPIYHKVHNNGTYYLNPEIPTLAEQFKKKGYKTAAFVSSFNVDSRFGTDKGFDVYDDTYGPDEMIKTFRSERKAGATSEAFIHWLEGLTNEKFFSWIHYYDPHMPYRSPSPFKEEFAGIPYDGEIAYMDYSFGKVIEKLREKGLLDQTLIVIAGDHGEALGEKGEVDHGVFIYDVTMRIPLILYAPTNLPEGMVVDSRVRLIDIMPSVLDLLMMPVNKGVQGISLLPYIEGKRKDDLACYLESYYPLETYGWSELVGLIDGDWKYIQAPRSELYRIKVDKGEEKNLFLGDTKTVAALKQRLKQVIADYSSKFALSRRKMSQEEEERLRSLGYVGADASVKISKGPLSDPKDMMGEMQILYQAVQNEWDGNMPEAEKYYREILRLMPDVAWRYLDLAIFLSKVNRMPEAIEVLKQGLTRMPDSFVLLSRLAHFYMTVGKYQEAFDMSQAALRMDPEYFDALIIAASVQDVWGKWEESTKYYKKALEIEPENKMVRLWYAYALGALGRGAEAVEIDETLKKESPNDYRIYQDLGIIYTSLDKLDLAEENLKKAVELKPSPETYLNYAFLLERVGKLPEAIRYLKLYLEKTPEGETPRKKDARRALADWERRIR
jgi:arylsulfatase A-like enzyme/tetratricopeptide (TPR) repeat protein